MCTIALWVRVPGGSASELKDDAERNGVGGSSYVNTNLTLTAPDIHPGPVYTVCTALNTLNKLCFYADKFIFRLRPVAGKIFVDCIVLICSF